jgi:hypothetical protein
MNNGSACSSAIPKELVADLIDATSFAEWRGFPLNRFVSIDLSGLEMRPQKFISSFLKRVGDWLRTNASPVVYVWVLENPPRGHLNCHILVHVPELLMKRFRRRQRGWCEQAGARWNKSLIRSQKVGIKPGTRDRKLSLGERLEHTEYALSYMLKGADREVCDLLRIDWDAQGGIIGKRAGTSERIGRKARRQAGYSAPTSRRGAFLIADRYRLG